MDKQQKDAIFSVVESLYVQRYTGKIQMHMGCLYYAKLGIEILHKLGVRAIVQAGTMQWERIPPDLDDGKIPTHLTFKWTKTEPIEYIIYRTLLTKELPEMHAWIALPDENEVVDFSTAHLATYAEQELGMKWASPPPPHYLWCEAKASAFPRGVYYHATKEACVLAHVLITDLNEMFAYEAKNQKSAR